MTKLTRRGFFRGDVLARTSDGPRAPWEARARAALAAELAPREARVLPFECIGPASFCTVCVERCPVPGALEIIAGRPRVDPSRCDGCGACEEGCPAPRKAIVVAPRWSPVAWASTGGDTHGR